MEKAREFLEKYTTGEAADEVSRLRLPPHRPLAESSFYECFGGRGVRLDVLRPDLISSSFKVPPRLLGGDGNLTMGAISTLVDLLGAAVAYQGEDSWNLSADMSISYISPAKLDIGESKLVEEAFFLSINISSFSVKKERDDGIVAVEFWVEQSVVSGTGNMRFGVGWCNVFDLLLSVSLRIFPWHGMACDLEFASHISLCRAWFLLLTWQDELEILARCLGRRGGYSGTHVLIRNKITGAVVAEGRHSLFDARSNL
ncbi:hypothetical protein SASPL_105054 [Salvia splendens]|uniref:Acyl-coenzyme A thioesterase 13 n=1 Tax=Salvia splendens TaxID=180675 RepID=A0A8X8YIB8_SALSN|nr:hypothetical protein SASPL_105054 [Salvia splendens]